MEAPRGKWVAIGGALAALCLLLLCAYVAAYFAVVEPVYGTLFVGSYPKRAETVVEVVYPQEWMEGFFSPLHRLDRSWFRPKVWNP